MSNYIFTPSPTYGRSEHPYTTWNDAFTSDEISQIIKIGESYNPTPAIVGEGDVVEDLRTSETSWIPLTSETDWLYNRLAHVVRGINGQFYGYDLYGFSEHFQYTVYKSEENKSGHYTWHQDSNVTGNVTPRKLSLSLQLTDPSEYEGGNLEILTQSEPFVMEKKLGHITVFPSYTLHRVTPVTKGIRRSLVVWITGPAFR